jgi:hypothetical protein
MGFSFSAFVNILVSHPPKTREMEMKMKMSASSPAMNFSPAHVGDVSETKNTTRSRPIRQGSYVLAVAAALAAAACTGGAGLDTPTGPVDHSCPHGISCGTGRSGG